MENKYVHYLFLLLMEQYRDFLSVTSLLGVKFPNPIKRVNTCQLFPSLFSLYNVMQPANVGLLLVFKNIFLFRLPRLCVNRQFFFASVYFRLAARICLKFNRNRSINTHSYVTSQYILIFECRESARFTFGPLDVFRTFSLKVSQRRCI